MDRELVSGPKASSDEEISARAMRESGYDQLFHKGIDRFASFSLAFSHISVATGVFTTFGFMLAEGGPRGIWMWIVAAIGQLAVACIYSVMATKLPLAGDTYQWASRWVSPYVGWWFGWGRLAFLTVVTVSVDYAFVQVAFQPLVGQAYSTGNAALETVIVIAIQGLIIGLSTRVTTKVNNLAVIAEVAGVVGLTVALFIAAGINGTGDIGNVVSTGVVPHDGYFRWLGPFMLSVLIGAYTIVGWETSANFVEETVSPRKVIPRAMIGAVAASGLVGFLFLLALAVSAQNIGAVTESAAPVAEIARQSLGVGVEKILLAFVCFSVFACGLVVMATNGRLIWSMARDERLPGSRLLGAVRSSKQGPPWATAIAALIPMVIVLSLLGNSNVLITLFGTATIIPVLVYAGAVLLYIGKGRTAESRFGAAETFTLGRWEIPVVATAVLWIAFELCVLLIPSEFREAVYYTLVVIGIGTALFLERILRARRTFSRAPRKEAAIGGSPRTP